MPLIPFATTVFLLAMLPGVGQALMMRQALTRGRRAALVTAAGTAAGLMVWSTAAGLGLAGLLLAEPAAMVGVRVIGGGVLIWLGVRTLIALRRNGSPVLTGPDGTPGRTPSGLGGDFVTGLATNLGNPKAGVFAISMLPQFLPTGAGGLAPMVQLGGVWAAVTTAWYALFIWTVGHGRALLTGVSVQRRLNLAIGLVLIGLGISVWLS